MTGKQEFRFNIGDFVCLRHQHARGIWAGLQCYQIEARITEECHGGVQRFYQFVGTTGRVPEFAVMAFSDFREDGNGQ